MRVGTRSILGSGLSVLAQKYNASGVVQWRWGAPLDPIRGNNNLADAVENPDGTIALTGTIGSAYNADYDIPFIKLSAMGQLLIQKELRAHDFGDVRTSIPGANRIMRRGNGYMLAARASRNFVWIALDSSGSIYPNKIRGRCYSDSNYNCLPDIGEAGLANRLVTATDGTNDYYTHTNALGEYVLDVGQGTFTVSINNPSPYWNYCPNPQTTIFNSDYVSDTLDFGYQVVTNCAHLYVDISAPFLRRCFPTTYTVTYDNQGTIDADSAYVEVTLDAFLTYNSSSIPLVQQVGNVYRFDVGTIAPFAQGSFQISVTPTCSTAVLLSLIHI